MEQSTFLKAHLRKIDRVSERNDGRGAYVCLDRNERASPFSEPLLRDLLNTLRSSHFTAYPDPGPFYKKLSGALGINEDFLVITPGADGAIRRAFMAFVPEDGTVVGFTPSYAMYGLYTEMFKGHLIGPSYETIGHVSPEPLIESITEKADIVLLANPDQPTGNMFDLGSVRRICRRAAEAGAVCIIDETYHAFSRPQTVPLVQEFDNLLLVRSFSKAPGLASLRLGYAVGQPHLINALEKVRGASEVSGLSLAVGEYFLDRPGITAAFVDEIEKSRSKLIALAETLGFRAPPCPANFQILEAPPHLDPLTISATLKSRGYLVKSGYTHPSVQRCIRITLDAPEVIDPFLDHLREAVALLT